MSRGGARAGLTGYQRGAPREAGAARVGWDRSDERRHASHSNVTYTLADTSYR